MLPHYFQASGCPPPPDYSVKISHFTHIAIAFLIPTFFFTGPATWFNLFNEGIFGSHPPIIIMVAGKSGQGDSSSAKRTKHIENTTYLP
jgi:hypothetical protein